MVLPLFSPTGLLSRLTSIYLGFAPAFLLLSIGYFFISLRTTQNIIKDIYGLTILVLGSCYIYFFFVKKPCRYEAVFYGALALALMAWILVENVILYISQKSKSSSSTMAMEDDLVSESDDRCLQLSDMRIPLAFVSYKSPIYNR